MSKVGTKGQKLTDFLAFESFAEEGFCRKTATVTFETGMTVGAVLVLNAGKYVWVNTAAVANVANGVAVLVQDPTGLTAGDQSLAVLYRGPAGLAAGGLQWKGTVSAGDQATVLSKFDAQNVASRTQV